MQATNVLLEGGLKPFGSKSVKWEESLTERWRSLHRLLQLRGQLAQTGLWGGTTLNACCSSRWIAPSPTEPSTVNLPVGRIPEKQGRQPEIISGTQSCCSWTVSSFYEAIYHQLPTRNPPYNLLYGDTAHFSPLPFSKYTLVLLISSSQRICSLKNGI